MHKPIRRHCLGYGKLPSTETLVTASSVKSPVTSVLSSHFPKLIAPLYGFTLV